MPTSTSFHTRNATNADVDAIQLLIERSVRELQKHDYTPAQIDGALGSALGIDRQLIADQTYFVTTPSDDPTLLVACGGWSFRSTLYGSDQLNTAIRNSNIIDPTTGYAKIRAIFVHPDWARRGLGSLMLAHCEAAAQAAGFTRFEMGSTLTGIPLYKLRGYTEHEHTFIPLPNGEHVEVIRMTRTLT